MTIAEILELKSNGGGLNLYLPAKFANDSNSHSLAPDEQYVTHCLPGGGFVVLPVERLLEAYPLTVREPPPGVLRRVLDDEDGAEFDRIPFTRTDVRDFRSRLTSDTETDSPGDSPTQDRPVAPTDNTTLPNHHD